MHKLFGAAAHELAKPAMRGISSKDTKNRILYIRQKCKYLARDRLFERLQEAKELGMGCPSKVLEALGRDWARSSLAAEAKCKKKDPSPYAPEIDELRRERRLLAKMESQKKNRLDLSEGIKEGSSGAMCQMPGLEARRATARLSKETKRKCRQAGRLRKAELAAKEKEKLASKDAGGAKATRAARKAGSSAKMRMQRRPASCRAGSLASWLMGCFLLGRE